MRALGVRHRAARLRREVRVHGVGLHGLAAPGHDARHGQCGHGDAPVHGVVVGADVRFATDRRRIPDEAADGARREAAARDGRRCAHARRQAAGRDAAAADGCTASITACRVASAQVKSAILLAALYAEGATTVTSPAAVPRSQRADAGELRACKIVDRGSRRPRIEPPARLASQRLEVPGDFSSAAFFIVAGLLGAAPERVWCSRTSA